MCTQNLTTFLDFEFLSKHSLSILLNFANSEPNNENSIYRTCINYGEIIEVM